MIRLNLSWFGGGSSGSDGLAAAQNNGSMKPTAKKEYHGSAGSTGNFGGKSQSGSSSKSSSRSSSKGEVVRGGLNPNETYEVYEVRNGKESNPEEWTGKEIMSSLAYRSSTDKWHSKELGQIYHKKSNFNGRYIIRKKRK